MQRRSSGGHSGLHRTAATAVVPCTARSSGGSPGDLTAGFGNVAIVAIVHFRAEFTERSSKRCLAFVAVDEA